jgi:hypothetical protein
MPRNGEQIANGPGLNCICVCQRRAAALAGRRSADHAPGQAGRAVARIGVIGPRSSDRINLKVADNHLIAKSKSARKPPHPRFPINAISTKRP